MRLKDIESFWGPTVVDVIMGPKYKNTRCLARFKRIERFETAYGAMDLVVVEPMRVINSRCEWSGGCIGRNIAVEPKQILREITRPRQATMIMEKEADRI